jgi:hypothetical protein
MIRKTPTASNNIRPNLANEYAEIMRLREQLNALSPKRAVLEELSPAHTEAHQAPTEQTRLGRMPRTKAP